MKVSYYIAPGMSLKQRKDLQNPLSVSDIMKIVCERYEVDPFDLKNSSRQRDLVFARHVAMYLLSSYTGLSFIKVGKLFNRDHTTVLHARKMIANYLETNSFNKREEINELINRCEYRDL